MNIRYITCSDLREDVPHKAATDLLNISDKVELGIQAHSFAMNNGLARNVWFNKLLDISMGMPRPLNIALHVNYNWCSDFCTGKIVPELLNWLELKHIGTGEPMIKRWQLNIGDGTGSVDTKKVADIIANYPNREFIFPYNSNRYYESSALSELDAIGSPFSLLFDASYGAGISPADWSAPIYDNHPMGYAGGLCGENLEQNLDKISRNLPRGYEFWIDAEGKLMTPGVSPRKFDIARGTDYINHALKWLEKNR